LKYLEWYDISEEEKIKKIEELYKLANITYGIFKNNDGKIPFLDEEEEKNSKSEKRKKK